MEMEDQLQWEWADRIMSLPEEVRRKIFNKLPQNQAIALRGLNRDWRDEIDNLFEFNIKLDEGKSFMQDLLQLHIKKCKIVRLLPFFKPQDTRTIFKTPSLVKSLEISCARITPSNLHKILLECAEHLTQLDVDLRLHLLKNDIPGVNYIFKNLRRLSLTMDTSETYTVENEKEDVEEDDSKYFDMKMVMGSQFYRVPMNLEDTVFHRISRQSSISNLQSLELSCYSESIRLLNQFSVSSLALIASHWKTLKTVYLHFYHVLPELENEEDEELSIHDLESVDMTRLRKVCNISKLSINIDSTLTAAGPDLWEELLENQSSLEFLSTNIMGDNIPLLKSTIWKHSHTLTSIHITFLDITPQNRPFDLSIFQNCSSLRELSIIAKSTVSQRILNYGYDRRLMATDVKGFQFLPKRIEGLRFKGMEILTTELLKLFAPERFQFLKRLKLSLNQLYLKKVDRSPWGVDRSVVQQIITLPSIVSIHISTFSYAMNCAEAMILFQPLFDSVGCRTNDDGTMFTNNKLIVCRESTEHDWECN